MFATTELDAYIDKKGVRLEAQRRELLLSVRQAIQELGREFPMQEAFVFGSLAHEGRYHDDSDIDVAVSIAPKHFFRLKSRLERDLGRSVDLVDLQEAHFSHRIRGEGVPCNPGD